MENLSDRVSLISAGEDERIRIWSMKMEMLMDIDLNRSDLFDKRVKFNHSVCSLDIFCCYEPKEYLSKTLGIKTSSKDPNKNSQNVRKSSKKRKRNHCGKKFNF